VLTGKATDTAHSDPPLCTFADVPGLPTSVVQIRAVLCTPGWAGRLWQTVACSSLVAPLAPPIATGTLWSRFSLPNAAGWPSATAADGVGYIGGPETGHGVPGTSLAIACLCLAL
jgi:hypothetical protein